MNTLNKPKLEKLTSKNSNLYVATKAPKNGDYNDAAKSVRVRAKTWKHAESICKERKLRLDGLFVENVKPAHVGWHIRSKAKKETTHHSLYYFNQLIESGYGISNLKKYQTIAVFLNERNMQPIALCAGDYSSVEEAQRIFNQE